MLKDRDSAVFDNPVAYLKAREKLFSLSYVDLERLYGVLGEKTSYKMTRELIKNIITQKEKKNLFLLVEDIMVGNIPDVAPRPFYKTSEKETPITAFQPYAEYLYFYNLRLPYSKQPLLQKADELWAGERREKNSPSTFFRQGHDSFMPGSVSLAQRKWFFHLGQDRKSDFVFSLRQWPKMYEENTLRPIFYGESVILRNEHRIFCIDRETGQQLWSLGDLGHSGEEYYQTLRHPHHGASGYELFADQGKLFSELNGKLIAVDLSDILAPVLIWSVDLGEYTLCTKPFHEKGILTAGLVNSKGEFWVCGFLADSGVLTWATYIGLTSFLSPPCSIGTASGDKLFLATNVGVLVVLDYLTGQIIWIRKYKPKAYSLFDFWLNADYEKRLRREGFIEFDTQFIEGMEQELYYKPRESDYFYVLDPKNGSLKDSLMLDSTRYYLLGVCSGDFVFLKKRETAIGQQQIIVVEPGTGRKVFSSHIQEGPLKGVVKLDQSSLAFKSGKSLHVLSRKDKKKFYHAVEKVGDGWLLEMKQGQVLLGKDRDLICVDIFKKESISSKERLAIREYLRQRQDTTKELLGISSHDSQAIDMEVYVKNLQDKLTEAAFPIEDFKRYLTSHVEKFRKPIWNTFFTIFVQRHPFVRVTYSGVDMNLVDFLRRSGVVDPSSLDDRGVIGQILTGGTRQKGIAAYRVKGERLFLLPVSIIRGPRELDYYLLLNYDQLLCVDECGNVLWQRKIFNSNPYTEICDFVDSGYDRYQDRMDVDTIEAYLWENTLILNDHKNVVGIKASDGSYLWGLTNSEDSFRDKKILLPFDETAVLFKKYGINRSYLRKIAFSTWFLDDRLIAIHAGRIYSLDPATGFCFRVHELGTEGILDGIVFGQQLYVLSDNFDRIVVLDKEGVPLKTFFLDFIKEKSGLLQMQIFHGGILLSSERDFFILDRERGILKKRISLDSGCRQLVYIVNDHIVIVAPFEKVSCYDFKDGSWELKWEEDLGSSSDEVFWANPDKSSQYAFIIKNTLWTLRRKDQGYFLISLDIDMGKKIWESYLEGAGGLFYCLSGVQKAEGEVRFILTTTCFRTCSADLDRCRKAKYANVDSRMFTVEQNTGYIKSSLVLPGTMASAENRYIEGFEGSSFTETERYLLYTVQANELRAEEKKR